MLTEKYKTYQRILPQFAALKRQAVDPLGISMKRACFVMLFGNLGEGKRRTMGVDSRFTWTTEQEVSLVNMASSQTCEAIAGEIRKTKAAVWHRCRLLGIKMPVKKQRQQQPINHEFFKTWSSSMAYVLGFWFADGCMYRNEANAIYGIEFASQDRDHLEAVRETLQSAHPIKHNTCFRLRIGSKTIYNDILALGGTPRKSLTALFPVIPEPFLYDFLRGNLDGDGSIILARRAKTSRPGLKTQFLGTLEFLSGLQKAVGIRGGLYRKKTSNHWGLAYGIQDSLHLLTRIYAGNGIRLERKFNVFRSFLQTRGLTLCV